MQCTCEGYSEPTLGEKVTQMEENYAKLTKCHAEVVAERDKLKEKVADLLFRLEGLQK